MRNTDFLEDVIEHSWGNSPKQKAREKEYNAEYYRTHKEKWANTARDIRNNPTMGSGQNLRIEPKKVDDINLKDANKFYLEAATKARNSPDKKYAGESLESWQEKYRFSKQQLDAIAEYNKNTAKKRSQTGQAENERSKAYDRAVKNRDRYLDKQQEREVYEKSFKGKAEMTTKQIVQTAKNTINEGADFVKSLFK